MTAVATPHPHHHDPAVAHQFDDAGQQKEAVTIGMWAFLVTEVLFFGTLFGIYCVYRWSYPAAFGTATKELNFWLGAVNTAVLLTSSLCIALGVRAAQLGQRTALVALLVVTCLLALVFMGVKSVEYAQKFEHHLVPTGAFSIGGFQYPGFDSTRLAEETCDHAREAGVQDFKPEEIHEFHGRTLDPYRIFFSLYFVMTGLHALHVVIGVGLMIWLLRPAMRGVFGPRKYNTVEVFGLYWHFVDIVWIFLYPILYLNYHHFH